MSGTTRIIVTGTFCTAAETGQHTKLHENCRIVRKEPQMLIIAHNELQKNHNYLFARTVVEYIISVVLVCLLILVYVLHYILV